MSRYIFRECGWLATLAAEHVIFTHSLRFITHPRMLLSLSHKLASPESPPHRPPPHLAILLPCRAHFPTRLRLAPPMAIAGGTGCRRGLLLPPLLFAAALLLSAASPARAFYLPGVAPRDFQKVIRFRTYPLSSLLPLLLGSSVRRPLPPVGGGGSGRTGRRWSQIWARLDAFVPPCISGGLFARGLGFYGSGEWNGEYPDEWMGLGSRVFLFFWATIRGVKGEHFAGGNAYLAFDCL